MDDTDLRADELLAERAAYERRVRAEVASTGRFTEPRHACAQPDVCEVGDRWRCQCGRRWERTPRVAETYRGKEIPERWSRRGLAVLVPGAQRFRLFARAFVLMVLALLVAPLALAVVFHGAWLTAYGVYAIAGATVAMVRAEE